MRFPRKFSVCQENSVEEGGGRVSLSVYPQGCKILLVLSALVYSKSCLEQCLDIGSKLLELLHKKVTKKVHKRVLGTNKVQVLLYITYNNWCRKINGSDKLTADTKTFHGIRSPAAKEPRSFRQKYWSILFSSFPPWLSHGLVKEGSAAA